MISAGLLLVDLDDVVLLHLEGLGRLVVVDAAAVEEEAQRGDGDADALRVRLLQLAHLRRHLDAEVDLVGVLAHHLQLDVLGLVLVLRHLVGVGVGGEGGVEERRRGGARDEIAGETE